MGVVAPNGEQEARRADEASQTAAECADRGADGDQVADPRAMYCRPRSPSSELDPTKAVIWSALVPKPMTSTAVTTTK